MLGHGDAVQRLAVSRRGLIVSLTRRGTGWLRIDGGISGSVPFSALQRPVRSSGYTKSYRGYVVLVCKIHGYETLSDPSLSHVRAGESATPHVLPSAPALPT